MRLTVLRRTGDRRMLSQHVAELGLAENMPGYNFCVQTEGGIVGGCMPLIRACAFYRVYVMPTDATAYELFDCLAWDTIIKANVRETVNGLQKDSELVLYPGITTQWGSVKLTATLSEAASVLLTDKFLYDGKRIAVVTAEEEALLSLRCGSQANASRFSCKFPPTACVCHTSGNGVNCICPDGLMPSKLMRDGALLPRNQGPVWLTPKGNTVEAEPHIMSMDLVVSVEEYTTQAYVDASYCHLQFTTLEGCYACESGATTNATCSTDFGTAAASVNCGKLTFGLRCEPGGVTEALSLTFNDPTIDIQCTAYCPASQATAKLTGQLIPGGSNDPNIFDAVKGPKSPSHEWKVTLGTIGP